MLLNFEEYWVEHQGEEERGKWVSLVEPCQAPDVGAAEDEVGGGAVGSGDLR